MANKQLNEVNLARDLGATGQNFALKLIDNGTSYSLYVEDLGQEPTQPALASQITATGIPVIAPSGAGDVVGLGTTGNLPLWTDGPNSVIGDSVLTQVAGNLVQPTGNFTLSAGTTNLNGAVSIDSNGSFVSQASLTLNKVITAGSGSFFGQNLLTTLSIAVTGIVLVNALTSSTHTSGNIAQLQAALFQATQSGVGGTVSSVTALIGTASQGTGSGAVTNLIGITANTFVFGTTTTDRSLLATGFLGAAGIVTTINLIESRFSYTAGGTIVSLRGLFIGGWSGNPPATNLDGILIDTTIDAAAAATKFAIRSLSVSPSLFSGTIQAATGVDLGSTTTPFRDLYLFGSGTYSTTSLKLTGTPTGARVVTFPDVSITVARSDAAQILTGNQTINGNVILNTAGNGLSVKEGSNATMGTGILNGATEVTISTTKVTASSRIFLSIQAPGGTPLGVIYVSSRNAGTSFGVKGATTDTSTFAWWIVEPA